MPITYKKATVPHFSVKAELHRAMASVEAPRPHYPLRASDMMPKAGEFCPREHAFLDLKAAHKRPEFLSTSLRMTFDVGRFVETRVRHYLQRTAVGFWKCRVCGSKQRPIPTPYPAGACLHCKAIKGFDYDEVRFKDPVSGISGGMDILISTKGSKGLQLVEIKSMASDAFKDLLAPLAEHRFRTLLYLRIIANADNKFIANSVNQESATVLYVSKGFGVKDDSISKLGIKDQNFSPFKEFKVLRDDSVTQTAIDRATALTKWRENPSKGMLCGVCPNGLVKRAQSCPAVVPCFSGNYPGTLTWVENGKPRHAEKSVIA